MRSISAADGRSIGGTGTRVTDGTNKEARSGCSGISRVGSGMTYGLARLLACRKITGGVWLWPCDLDSGY